MIHQARPRRPYVSELPGKLTCLPVQRPLSLSQLSTTMSVTVSVTAAGDWLGNVSYWSLPDDNWQPQLSCHQLCIHPAVVYEV